MTTHNLIPIDDFLPDVEPELKKCPVPVIERRLREAMIEACERANIWRWEHPEIPVTAGLVDYCFTGPTAESEVHSVLKVDHNGREIFNAAQQNCPTTGFHVVDRGRIRLTREPKRSSSPFRAINAPEITLIEPVDPGAVQDGFNASFPRLDVTVVDASDLVITTNPDVATINIPASPVGGLITLDFSNLDLTGVTDIRNVFLARTDASGSGYLTLNEALNNDLVVDNSGSAGTTGFIRIGDIRAAQDAGTPFITVLYRESTVTVGYKSVSAWASTADEFLFAEPQQDYTTVTPLTPGSGDRMTLNGSAYETNTTANRTAMLPVTTASLYSYVSFRVATSTTRAANPNLEFHIVDPNNGERFEYEMDWQNLAYEGTIAEAAGDAFTLGTFPSNLEYVFWVKKQAVADGEKGILSLRGRRIAADFSNESWFSGFEVAPDEFIGNRVTQADVDAYLLALAAYNAQVTALRDWEAAENRPITGLEACVTIKPTRNAMEVSEVLYRDYHKLIVMGTLAKAFAMKDRPWSDIDMAGSYARAFEFELAKAKSAIDRGFVTESQKVKPRRFV